MCKVIIIFIDTALLHESHTYRGYIIIIFLNLVSIQYHKIRIEIKVELHHRTKKLLKKIIVKYSYLKPTNNIYDELKASEPTLSQISVK